MVSGEWALTAPDTPPKTNTTFFFMNGATVILFLKSVGSSCRCWWNLSKVVWAGSLLLYPPRPASVRLSVRPGSLCSSNTAAPSRETAASLCARHAGTRFKPGLQNKSTHTASGEEIRSLRGLEVDKKQQGHVRFIIYYLIFFSNAIY